ncbi:MAG: HIT family protein [Bacillota bacterium]
MVAVASEGCAFYIDYKPELENDLTFVIASPEPIVEGHSLVVPKRHCGDYFEMSERKIRAVNELLKIRRKELLERNRTIKGFEVMANMGNLVDYSGHCQVHLVPRG